MIIHCCCLTAIFFLFIKHIRVTSTFLVTFQVCPFLHSPTAKNVPLRLALYNPGASPFYNYTMRNPFFIDKGVHPTAPTGAFSIVLFYKEVWNDGVPDFFVLHIYFFYSVAYFAA